MTTALSEKPALKPSDTLDATALLEMFRQMILIRRFEERAAQSYQQAKIGGFCHLYIGQEATAVGSIAAVRPDDPIITAYRDHGHGLARGMHPNYAMAEMYGKITGCAKGKGGSMHFFDKAHHMYGGHAIVGGQCPMGIGLAFATQYMGEDKVTLCFFGDGALNQGAVHEAMNLAAIWRLPIIFVVENNMYSMGTHIARGTSMADDLSVKAKAYGMLYAECDGMDVIDTYNVFKTLADGVRGSTSKALGVAQEVGTGPAFVNAKTYRFKGHSMSDPQKYRSKEEVAAREQQDPINRLANHIMEKGFATQQQLDAIDEQNKQIALDAVKFASESPDTPVEELFTDIYSMPYPPYPGTSEPIMIKNNNSGQ